MHMMTNKFLFRKTIQLNSAEVFNIGKATYNEAYKKPKEANQELLSLCLIEVL